MDMINITMICALIKINFADTCSDYAHSLASLIIVAVNVCILEKNQVMKFGTLTLTLTRCCGIR